MMYRVSLDWKLYSSGDIKHCDFETTDIKYQDEVIERNDFHKDYKVLLFELSDEFKSLSPLTDGSSYGVPVEGIQKISVEKII